METDQRRCQEAYIVWDPPILATGALERMIVAGTGMIDDSYTSVLQIESRNGHLRDCIPVEYAMQRVAIKNPTLMRAIGPNGIRSL